MLRCSTTTGMIIVARSTKPSPRRLHPSFCRPVIPGMWKRVRPAKVDRRGAQLTVVTLSLELLRLKFSFTARAKIGEIVAMVFPAIPKCRPHRARSIVWTCLLRDMRYNCYLHTSSNVSLSGDLPNWWLKCCTDLRQASCFAGARLRMLMPSIMQRRNLLIFCVIGIAHVAILRRCSILSDTGRALQSWLELAVLKEQNIQLRFIYLVRN